MSKIFDFSDVATFAPFSPHGSRVDVYFVPRKRSRITAPFVNSCEPKQQQPSIEVLPDECLFEIFRRLTGGQERSACACVSKRWLVLSSTIQRDELCTSKTVQPAEAEIKSNPQKENNKEECGFEFDDPNGIESGDEECRETDEFPSHGYLSRCLEGKKATDVRLAAIAVGTANRGGLGKLSIRGGGSTCGPTDLGLVAISRGCPGLRALSLWNLSTIGDEGLCEIASGCHSLEKIDLCHCPGITDKGLIAIAMNCPDLTSVAIESCSNIGNESLRALGRYCPNLKYITVRNCPLVGDQGIGGLFSSAGHSLKKAKLDALNINDVSLAVIGHYGSEMTDLGLASLQNVNERGFWVMGKGRGLKKLKSLSITACRGVSDLGIEALGKGCPDLKAFTLRKCSIVSDHGLVSFAKGAESLECLKLEECHRITLCGVVDILANCCKKLKALALENCIGIQDLEEFRFPLTSRCISLRSLTIRRCLGFGDAGLGMLATLCPKLTQLDLSGLKRITDAGILPLAQSSEAGLAKVNLSECANVTDNAVTVIAKLHGETLEILNLDGCRCVTDVSLMAIARNCRAITELDVSRCGITDSGIAALAAAERIGLRVLSLKGCSLVSDQSLPVLVVLGENLVGLNVRHCRGIGSGTVDLLVDRLWRCDILS